MKCNEELTGFVGAFRKAFEEKSLLISSYLSVDIKERVTLEIFLKFHILVFYENLSALSDFC